MLSLVMLLLIMLIVIMILASPYTLQNSFISSSNDLVSNASKFLMKW